MALIILYNACFIIAFLYIVALMIWFREHISVFYFLLAVTIALANFGYAMIPISRTLETAILANRVAYVGGAFTSYLMVVCIARLCHHKIPIVLDVFGWLGSIVVCLGCFSSNYTQLYYKSLEIVTYQGSTILKKEYGPLHTIYPIFITACLIYGIAIVTISSRQNKKLSYVSSILSLTLMLSTAMIYLVQSGLNLAINLMPIAYVIGFAILLVLLTRIRLYDISGISMEAMESTKQFGFVIFDLKGRFEAADEQAMEWFPELERLRVDKKIDTFDTAFLQQIERWLKNEDRDKSIWIPSGNLTIEASLQSAHEKSHKHSNVHCIRLRDDTKQQQYLRLIENYSEDLEREVDKKTAKLSKIQEDILFSMAAIVENRDSSTGGHIRRTSDVVKVFVKHLGETEFVSQLPKKQAEYIINAAPLHDFGKIAISDAVLNKPGKFTDEEYNEMKKHSAKGAIIVARILKNADDEEFKKVAVNVAHYHHEKWDGSGYPDRLKEIGIPFEARVMALADVFDALVSKRVYKEQFDYDKAFKIIEESRGTHFDPVLCDYFLECREELIKLYDSYDD